MPAGSTYSPNPLKTEVKLLAHVMGNHILNSAERLFVGMSKAIERFMVEPAIRIRLARHKEDLRYEV